MERSTRHRSEEGTVFERWMAEHRGIIVKTVRSFTSDASDADDLTQDIMLAIWRSVPSFRGDAKPSTWIWRIALNQAISWRRAAASVHTGLHDVAEPSTSERIDEQLRVDWIFDAIRTLKPIDRSLIVLSLEGYRYEEISAITGLTETNVGARLSRARTRITAQLEGTS